MAIGDIYRFSMVGSANDNLVVWTLHAKMISSVADPQDFAAAIKTDLLQLLDTYEPSDFQTDRIAIYRVTLPHIVDEYTTGFPIPGAAAAGLLPNQLAIVTTLRTALAGRSYRGRVYLPATNPTTLSDGQWNTTVKNAHQTYFDDFIAEYGASGTNADWQLVIYSRKLGTSQPVTSAVVRANPGTVRRRRLGVGA